MSGTSSSRVYDVLSMCAVVAAQKQQQQAWWRRRWVRWVGLLAGASGLAYWAYRRSDVGQGISMMKELQEQMKSEEERQRKMRLERGYQSNMEAASLTLRSASVQMREKLDQLFDIAALKTQLKRGKRDAAEYERLENFKVQVVARTLTSLACVCLLDPVLRLQMHIIGRHIYVDSKQSSTSVNRRFLATIEHFIANGMERVAQHVLDVVREHLVEFTLQTPCTREQFADRFQRIWCSVFSKLYPDLEHLFIGALQDVERSETTSREETFQLAELVAELKELLGSNGFAAVLQRSLVETAGDAVLTCGACLPAMGSSKAPASPEGQTRFGTIIPRLSKLYEQMLPFETGSALGKSLEQAADLNELCSIVYYPLSTEPRE